MIHKERYSCSLQPLIVLLAVQPKPDQSGMLRFFIGAEAGAGLNKPKCSVPAFQKKHYNILIPF